MCAYILQQRAPRIPRGILKLRAVYYNRYIFLYYIISTTFWKSKVFAYTVFVGLTVSRYTYRYIYFGRTRAHVPGDSANAQFPDRYVDLGYIILYYVVPRRFAHTRIYVRILYKRETGPTARIYTLYTQSANIGILCNIYVYGLIAHHSQKSRTHNIIIHRTRNIRNLSFKKKLYIYILYLYSILYPYEKPCRCCLQ